MTSKAWQQCALLRYAGSTSPIERCQVEIGYLICACILVTGTGIRLPPPPPPPPRPFPCPPLMRNEHLRRPRSLMPPSIRRSLRPFLHHRGPGRSFFPTSSSLTRTSGFSSAVWSKIWTKSGPNPTAPLLIGHPHRNQPSTSSVLLLSASLRHARALSFATSDKCHRAVFSPGRPLVARLSRTAVLRLPSPLSLLSPPSLFSTPVSRFGLKPAATCPELLPSSLLVSVINAKLVLAYPRALGLSAQTT